MIKTKELKQKTVGAGPVSAQKGITLIALIITIIVMLILVGVTINMAINGGLFTHAGKAVSDTQNAIDEEQALASGEIKIGDSWYNSMDDYLNGVESVRSLQEKHVFEYYSSFSKAIADANNNTKENADSDKEEAVAGIYTTDDGKNTVVLLKDTTENARVTLSADMTINLGGNTLFFDKTVGLDMTSGNVTIDGRISGSSIEGIYSDESAGSFIQIRTGNLSIKGGKYSGDSEIGERAVVLNAGNLNITDATVIGTSANGSIRGIETYPSSTSVISNSNIKTYSNLSEESYSRGIYNSGTMTVNNCYIMGIHSGISNFGYLFVNGGTYEGVYLGGIVCAEEGRTSYIRNANIRECAMPEGYTSTIDSSNAGFYIGANNNIKVYMDNCDIYGSVQPMVLGGTQNNTLYISNSKINTDKKITIGNDTHKLYIGKGCNFTAENTTNPSAVIVTDEVYTQSN